jgi:hypothetical protein
MSAIFKRVLIVPLKGPVKERGVLGEVPPVKNTFILFRYVAIR